jgi:hypothetical protein
MEKRREDASRGIAYNDTGREGEQEGNSTRGGTRGKQQERENQMETGREVEPR